MKKVAFGCLCYGLLGCAVLQAATITVTIPDETFKRVIEQVCEWNHCESDGEQTDTEKLEWTQLHVLQPAIDMIVNLRSYGHYPNLWAVGGTLKMTYDASPPQESE